MYDIIIRGGTVIDGTGTPGRAADVAITGDRIVEVGTVIGEARRVIDATGLIVTPGVVDIHTHYDGQATWDPDLTPSCWHGVTTIVMGNCGVGFAPCAPGKENWLVQLMEGVEDIPGTALHEGMTWGWETFPEFLDVLDRTPRVIDIAAQVPHGAVRGYVMGDRGARNEPATAADIAAMAAVVKAGIEAGALGFSTSRTLMHRAIDGEPVPGTYAAHDELFGIGEVLRDLGTGVYEVAPAGVAGEDLLAPEREVSWMAELAAHIGRPVTFAMTQNNGAPDAWRALLDASKKATEAGAALTAQVAGRPSGLLFGLGTTYHPLDDRPSFQAIRSLPSGEATHQLRDPEVRARILAEAQDYESDYRAFLRTRYDRMFPMPDPVDYEPSYEQSIAGIAAARGVTPVEALLDLTADNPAAIFQALILNYANGDAEPLREMLQHPAAAVGLSDGGAHVAILCDASIPTTMLTHWARDRRRGERLPLELVVKRQTHDTAHLYGLGDRGVVAPGMLADLNVIDFEHLNVQPPELRYDLPGGARRLVQRARGYVATIKSGVVTVDHDELTGARPGALVRGAR